MIKFTGLFTHLGMRLMSYFSKRLCCLMYCQLVYLWPISPTSGKLVKRCMKPQWAHKSASSHTLPILEGVVISFKYLCSYTSQVTICSLLIHIHFAAFRVRLIMPTRWCTNTIKFVRPTFCLISFPTYDKASSIFIQKRICASFSWMTMVYRISIIST